MTGRSRELGTVAFLDAGVEGVAIEVGDGKREEFRMPNNARAAASRAKADFGQSVTVAAESRHEVRFRSRKPLFKKKGDAPRGRRKKLS
jgi:hypothetical protein